MGLFTKAKREKLKLRLAIEGPSGSGKTFSALRVATGLVGKKGKIAVIDTEHRSALLYSDDFDFESADLKPPYTPERFVQYLNEAEKDDFDCVIIDSISHEWKGEGGVLEIHNNLGGNSFTAWGKINHRHDKLLTAILQSPVHIIVTMRSKQAYALEQNDKGKQVPVKLGLEPIQRSGVEYEFTSVFTISRGNTACGTKDRTHMFPADNVFIPSEETGIQLKNWLEKGKEVERIPVEDFIHRMSGCGTLEELQTVFLEVNEMKSVYPKSDMEQMIEAKNRLKEEILNKGKEEIVFDKVGQSPDDENRDEFADGPGFGG